MKVACFSVAALDYYPQLDLHFAGGNALNQAIRFRQVGIDSAFVGALGNDEAGDRLFDLLTAESVDCLRLHRVKGNTACNQLTNDEHGERYGVDGAWQGGVYEAFELTEQDWDYIKDFDIWATHANGPNYLDALRRKTSKQFLCVDFLHLKDYKLLRKSMNTVDIAYFGGTPDMVDELANIAKETGGLIVLTLGPEGSIAFHGDSTFKQAALTLDPVVDTTGCGDAFQTAFTAHYFKTRDVAASLLAGAELGRVAASAFGGVPWAQ